MRVLLAGGSGQLGLAVQQTWEEHEIIAPPSSEWGIADAATTRQLVSTVKPDLVLNAAAYTDVDGCESNRDTAYRVNALGPRNLASACLESGCALVHVSTNCVFDGQAREPYLEFDPTNPISVYGRSKLAGEEAVRSILPRHYIVRTAWLYSPHRRNFVKTILRLGAEKGHLRMVADEISTPTYAVDLARAILALVRHQVYGVYHFTNAGECSRLEYAREILRLAGLTHVELEPIALADYVRPSCPPLYSPLRNFCGEALGITLRPWQEALAEVVPQLVAEHA